MYFPKLVEGVVWDPEELPACPSGIFCRFLDSGRDVGGSHGLTKRYGRKSLNIELVHKSCTKASKAQKNTMQGILVSKLCIKNRHVWIHKSVLIGSCVGKIPWNTLNTERQKSMNTKVEWNREIPFLGPMYGLLKSRVPIEVVWFHASWRCGAQPLCSSILMIRGSDVIPSPPPKKKTAKNWLRFFVAPQRKWTQPWSHAATNSNPGILLASSICLDKSPPADDRHRSSRVGPGTPFRWQEPTQVA